MVKSTTATKRKAKAPRTVITVTHVGWKVGDTTIPSKAKAIKTARAQARKIHKAGGLAQVVVKNRKGRVETEWSYGDDPKHRKG